MKTAECPRDLLSTNCAIVNPKDFSDDIKAMHHHFDSDLMAREFLEKFSNQSFTVGQLIRFHFQEKWIFKLIVKELKVADIPLLRKGVELNHQSTEPRESLIGQCFPTTSIVFDRPEGSLLKLIKQETRHRSIINSEWDFRNMGIGGLDQEFSSIFRRAFASRILPQETIKTLKYKHVKGILLYGPPGTGKTLIARQICKLLNARDPKIVNGPDIFNKYVGGSEANIRKLFADAEEEEKKFGAESGLHVIIFDEIDAICKARGSNTGSSGVQDSVVNQLLSKIDGVKQLNNILVIGITNRRDVIDKALLRPGRLEVQLEIGLPNEAGRLQILQIHTAGLRESKKLAPDVDLTELVSLTKNFTGAELEGLVRAAQSTAMHRLIKITDKIRVDPEAAEKFMVNRSDFESVLENDIKPAFGFTKSDALDSYFSRGFISWGEPITRVFREAVNLIQYARCGSSGLVTLLIEGAPKAGKTAIAAQLAKRCDFSFTKMCTPKDVRGFTESEKSSHLKEIFDDAYRSEKSCVVIDNIERFLDYSPIGPRYSNVVLKTLVASLNEHPPKGRKLLVICTTSRKQVLEDFELLSDFSAVLHVSNISTCEQIAAVLKATNAFNANQVAIITAVIGSRRLCIGIKKLIDMIDMAKHFDEQRRVIDFLLQLESGGFLELCMDGRWRRTLTKGVA